MGQSFDNFALSPEQQDTLKFLDELLGQAIAARYEDFCRLSAGAFFLHVSKPMAAHALRELDSMLRSVLAVPMEAVAIVGSDFNNKKKDVRKLLRGLGFEDDLITEALKKLSPKISHKAQIEKIVSQLGLAKDGDIAGKWVTLTRNVGNAHGRSFHRSLAVDDDFRKDFQEPFDTVIRAIVVALRSRYTALMRRVETLAASPNYAQAVKDFANEIPGASPLQWHFFQRLKTGEWLPHLIKAGLVVEPMALMESIGKDRYFGAWPLGQYLLRMASSTDETTRRDIIAALNIVSGSNHPDVLRDGIAILAALPAEESAALADTAVALMARDTQGLHFQAPNDLVKNLATSQQSHAALITAKELLRIWGDQKKIESHYGQHMYEHHLPSLAEALIKTCSKHALELFVGLLADSERITDRVGYNHIARQSISQAQTPPFDICDALITTVCQSAEYLVRTDTVPMQEVIKTLTVNPTRTFLRIALHVLSIAPATAAELATSYLLDRELITASWCHAEYAELASAWYPFLPPENQAEILDIVDAVPNKFLTVWEQRFQEHHGVPPTSEDERRYRIGCVAELLWNWRNVLPPERQKVLEQADDPDAWRNRIFADEERALPAAAFSDMPVEDVLRFLQAWQPEPEGSRHTVTALSQDLQKATSFNPTKYAAAADRFEGLKPIHLRHLMDGLRQEASNQRFSEWSCILKLIQFVYGQANQHVDSATLVPGDDETWNWACRAASELLMVGLRLGKSGISTDHFEIVCSLVGASQTHVEDITNAETFDERFTRQPYYASVGTSRGIAVELNILLVRWMQLNIIQAPDDQTARAAFTRFPDIAESLEMHLEDRSPSARVPRAIIGRYLRVLHDVDRVWLMSQIPNLLPADDAALRNAAWRAHLENDFGPLAVMPPELLACYLEQVNQLAENTGVSDSNDGHSRFASYVMVLIMEGTMPEALLTAFERHAPAKTRRRAMWLMGDEVSKPRAEIPDAARARGLAYWERRLAAATVAGDPAAYKEELGTIGHWCFHGIVDEHWLCDQVLALLRIGLAPKSSHDMADWLHKIASRQVDRAVEILWFLVRSPDVERWTYMTNQMAIRQVLSEGRENGTLETIIRVRDIINHLASIGSPEFMDLEPSIQ